MRDIARRAARRGARPDRGQPGRRQDGPRAGARRSVDAEYARIQCTADLLPADVVGTNVFNQREGALRVPARAGVRERRAGRRDQPRVAEDAVGPARVHAGAPGDRRQAHARAGAAVRRARDPEPDRVRGHLSASRGAARPLHGARVARLPARRGRARHARPARRARPRARPRAGRRGRRGRSRPSRPSAGSTAATRCAATSSRCSRRRGPTRASSWARARARG